MAEPTSNFIAALKAVYDEKKVAGTLDTRDDRLVKYFIDNPVVRDPRNGRRLPIQTELHAKVRWQYQKEFGIKPLQLIDWSKLLQYLRDHWLDIIKFILIIAPFLI